MSSTWHSHTRPACAASQLQRPQHGTAVTPLPMCEEANTFEEVPAEEIVLHTILLIEVVGTKERKKKIKKVFQFKDSARRTREA
eukprot:1159049-Pelagomonas_calceolata.AAC.12